MASLYGLICQVKSGTTSTTAPPIATHQGICKSYMLKATYFA